MNTNPINESIKLNLNNSMTYKVKEITIRDFSKYKDKERKEIIIVKQYNDSDAWIPS